MDTARRDALHASRRLEIKAESPRSIAMDLTSLSPLPANSIDRDEPRLELETHIGIDSVIAVHDAILASSSSSSRTKRQPAELSDKSPSKKR